MPEYLRTGSATLDRLLGGRGVVRGSTILLRGEAGTGKTTLALQLARNAVANESHSAILILAEEPGAEALDQITQSYWGMDLQDYLAREHDNKKHYVLFNARGRFDVLAEEMAAQLAIRVASYAYMHELQMDEEEAMERARRELTDPTYESSLKEDDRRFYMNTRLAQMNLHDVFSQLWTSLLKPDQFIENQELLGSVEPFFVVVDSLNALIHSAQAHFMFRDDRHLLLSLLRSFRAAWQQFGKKGTILFTAEDTKAARSASESYVADVVIDLNRDVRTFEIPVFAGRHSRWAEELKFCRVRKGRALPTERRAVCYEFVHDPEYLHDNGLKFFPTYAAQGIVSLFYENEPQREVIETLRSVDVPALYPGVIVQQFTRSALQKASAIRRYAEKIPPRHALLLSNVDEYWVADLRRRKLLEPIPGRQLRLYSAQAVSQDVVETTTKSVRQDQEKPVDSARGKLVDEILQKRSSNGKRLFLSSNKKRFFAVPEFGNIGMLVYRHDLLSRFNFKPPRTWEDMEAICSVLRREKRPYKVLIETRTYDTLFSTLLELGWSNGVVWHTDYQDDGQTLKIEFDEGTFSDFLKVCKRLHRWVHVDQIVNTDSSVDPSVHPQADWVFARHWYSTWVDYYTRLDEQNNPVADLDNESMDFRITKIPVFRKYEKACRKHNRDVRHPSCWGEWYLAIQRGSENVELGIELINNLMTSRKISERALSGAGLPLQQQFYDDYGESMCFATNHTFNSIKRMFFADARTRTGFLGFRTVARVLSGKLQAIINNPNAKVEPLLLDAFHSIDRDFQPT